jgi:membrane protein
VRSYVNVITQALTSFSRDRCISFAAAISYFALFSLFPLLLVVMSFLGFFVHSASQKEAAVNALVALVGGGIARNTISTQVDAFAGGRGGIGVIGLVVAIWSASAVFGAIRTALDVAWKVPRPGPVVSLKLRDVTMVLFIGLLMLLALILTGLLTAVEAFSLHFFRGQLGGFAHVLYAIFAFVAPALVSFIGFALIYYLVPHVRVGPGDVWFGALIAALLFEGAQLAFGIYASKYAHYDRLYGSLAAAIALLFFLYISANILLLGAEITKAHADAHSAQARENLPSISGPQVRLAGRLLDTFKGLFVGREVR